MNKFSSKVNRVHMELGDKLLNSLRIKTQFLERLQSVSVVDGAKCLVAGRLVDVLSIILCSGGRCMSTSAWCPLENAFVTRPRGMPWLTVSIGKLWRTASDWSAVAG